MKRLVVALGIIAAIITVSVISLLMLKEACDTLTAQTKGICSSIDADDLQKAYEQAQQLDSYWQENKSKLSFFFRRHQITEIANTIALVKGLIMHEDIAQAAAACEQIAHQINELWQSELPLWGSVL